MYQWMLSCVLALTLAVTGSNPNLLPTSLDRVENGVVVLVDIEGQTLCAGSILNREGEVLTAAHCVSNLTDHFVAQIRGSSQQFETVVEAADFSKDLAVVRLTHPPKDLQPLRLAAGNSRVGDPVWIIGHPMGSNWLVTKGISSGFFRTRSPQLSVEIMKTDGIINPGNSGGPILNEQGEIVGVVSSIDVVIPNPFCVMKTGMGNAISLREARWFMYKVNMYKQFLKDTSKAPF